MARKKGYDPDQAIEAAMLAFWQKGYGALGVRQIETETSINRFALQTEFGGKKGLFLAALERYLSLSDETSLKPLAAGGIEAIKEFFITLVEGHDNDPRNLGCLMVNTVIENADLQMEDVQKITTQHYDNMRNMFLAALQQARSDGKLDKDFDCEHAARYLLTFAMGTEVFVRMNGHVNAAAPQVEFLLAEIDSWIIKPGSVTS